MSECPNIKVNKLKCNCTYEPCPRKGKCCECLQYHLSAGELPACVFNPSEERTYNRSIGYFVRQRSKEL